MRGEGLQAPEAQVLACLLLGGEAGVAGEDDGTGHGTALLMMLGGEARGRLLGGLGGALHGYRGAGVERGAHVVGARAGASTSAKLGQTWRGSLTRRGSE